MAAEAAGIRLHTTGSMISRTWFLLIDTHTSAGNMLTTDCIVKNYSGTVITTSLHRRIHQLINGIAHDDRTALADMYINDHGQLVVLNFRRTKLDRQDYYMCDVYDQFGQCIEESYYWYYDMPTKTASDRFYQKFHNVNKPY